MREDFHECHMSNPKGNYKGNPTCEGRAQFRTLSARRRRGEGGAPRAPQWHPHKPT
jgi:hypothetical protein